MDGGNRKSVIKSALRELRPVLAFFIPFVIIAVLFAALIGVVALLIFLSGGHHRFP